LAIGPFITKTWEFYFRYFSRTPSGTNVDSRSTFSRQTSIHRNRARLSRERELYWLPSNNRKICRVISIRDLERDDDPLRRALRHAVCCLHHLINCQSRSSIHSTHFPPGNSPTLSSYWYSTVKTIQDPLSYDADIQADIINIVDCYIIYYILLYYIYNLCIYIIIIYGIMMTFLADWRWWNVIETEWYYFFLFY